MILMSRPRKDSSFEVKPVTSQNLSPAPLAESQDFLLNEKRIWTVGLETLPDMEIEADSQASAIKAYNAAMGIIATEHAYRVS